MVIPRLRVAFKRSGASQFRIRRRYVSSHIIAPWRNNIAHLHRPRRAILPPIGIKQRTRSAERFRGKRLSPLAMAQLRDTPSLNSRRRVTPPSLGGSIACRSASGPGRLTDRYNLKQLPANICKILLFQAAKSRKLQNSHLCIPHSGPNFGQMRLARRNFLTEVLLGRNI